MQILHYEILNQPSVSVSILIIFLGGVALITGFAFLIGFFIKEEKPCIPPILLMLFSGAIMMGVGLASVTRPPEKYVYAKIDHSMPYVDMVEKYEFIECEDGIYKLKELPH